MITIQDLIPELKNDPKEYKLHCAIGPTVRLEPLISFINNEFKEWQEEQGNLNFERKYLLSLIYYNIDEWLFAGIYKRLSVSGTKGDYKYDTMLLETGDEYIGRLIIRFNKRGLKIRQSYLYLERYIQNLEVCELLKSRISFNPFPGYENVIVEFNYLKSIIDNEDKSWASALKSVKGIYLITDKLNGKNYVGAAYSEDAIWSRWKSYILDGHRDNKKLKECIKNNGYAYSQNFQFSILEIFAKTATDEFIIKRENHWKEKLVSRDFGYNDN